MPDPLAGEEVFREKKCANCHASGEFGAPDLGGALLRMTAAEIAGILWNHSYAMQDRMADAGIPFPLFQGNELGDLISYLHLVSYGGSSGNAERGRTLFREKGCGACHEDQRIEAPNLEASDSTIDAVALSAAMWNHAPQMYGVMADQEISWPKFEEGDMEDLVAYLRHLRGRGAADTP